MGRKSAEEIVKEIQTDGYWKPEDAGSPTPGAHSAELPTRMEGKVKIFANGTPARPPEEEGKRVIYNRKPKGFTKGRRPI